MLKKLIPVLGVFLLPAVALALEGQPLEKVARAYAVAQPGLQTYKATIDTDKIAQMIERATAGLPEDAPRPPAPRVVKYWSRASERSLIRAEGERIFPYMQEMVQRFSADFAIDLRSFLLPIDKAGERARLLENSRIRRSEHRIGESRIVTLTIDFKEPADLNGAFYGHGLAIPQQRVKELVVDLDPELEIITRMEVTTSAGVQRTVELRHYDIREGQLLKEVLVTSLDGAIDDHYQVRFDLVDGFWLPVRMNHAYAIDGRQDRIYVKFVDYEVNLEFPADIARQLQP